MASEAVHRAGAIANRDHAERLLATYPTDPTALRWVVTATFYSALHAMSAYLVSRGIVAENHGDRNLALANPANAVPPHVYAAYQFLQRRSVGARYHLRTFTPADVRRLLDDKLSVIFSFVGL